MKKLSPTNIFSKEHPFVPGFGLIGIVLIVLLVVTFIVQNREATLILTFEDGGRTFTGKVVKNMTILDALVASSKAGQIELKYSVSAYGNVIISSLDGYDSSSNDKKMVFYLNDKRIEADQINLVVIRPGDSIEVRLE